LTVKNGPSVPFTAFHAVLVWPLWITAPRRFDFVALTVGAMIPDLFEPYFNLVYSDSTYNLQRNWTHSLVGASSLDLAVGLAATVLVARPLLAWVNRKWPSDLWSRFANHDFQKRRSWTITLLSVWIGTLSHVLIDVPFHAAFRLFYPFVTDTWVFVWRLEPTMSLGSTVLFGPLFVYLLYAYWWRPSQGRFRDRGPARD
jgi:membrane-bound metal-dependent hydrolase YbcI (DUF457 family)